MIGTLVNVVAVVVGSLLGLLLRKGFPDKMKNTVTTGMGLCVILIGMQGALGTQNVLLVILSVVLGSIIGVALKIEERLDKLGLSLQKKFASAIATAKYPIHIGTPALIPLTNHCGQH